jgi:membrane protein
MDLQNRPRKHASADGWSIATALGLLAVAFVWDRMAPAQPKEGGGLEPKEDQSRHASPASLVTEGGDRGRHATSPSDIPARGWKDILWRVYGNIGNHRILALAAGMTYYSLLAIFPAIAALVAIYGLFADPNVIAKHLDDVAGFIPGGAIDVAREQLTRVATKGDRTLGFTFAIGLVISLWSANAAMKSLFDTLNIVYGEQEKRGFFRLNAMSLGFTIGAIVFVLAALGGVVVVPVVLQYVGLSNATDLLIRIGRWPVLFVALALAISYLPVRTQPEGPAMDLDHLGQCGRRAALARRVRAFLLLRREFRQLQPDLRLARCSDRLHDVALDLGHCDPARRGAERRDGTPDRARYHDRRA